MMDRQNAAPTLTDNKAVVRQYVELFNCGDWTEIASLFSEDALIYGVLGWGSVQDVMPIWTQLQDSLKMTLEIADIAAEGDTVAVGYTEQRTSVAPFFDKPRTGQSYEVVAMEWFVVRDGKIHRRWGARDSGTIYQQLGV